MQHPSPPRFLVHVWSLEVVPLSATQQVLASEPPPWPASMEWGILHSAAASPWQICSPCLTSATGGTGDVQGDVQEGVTSPARCGHGGQVCGKEPWGSFLRELGTATMPAVEGGGVGAGQRY